MFLNGTLNLWLTYKFECSASRAKCLTQIKVNSQTAHQVNTGIL